MSLHLVNLGRDTASCSGPDQAIGRGKRSAPCPSFAIKSGRLFLSGLLASIARLRFTDNASILVLPCRAERFIIER